MASETFGEALARWRRSRHMSQRKLAKLVPVSNGYISQLESGDKVPTPETAKALDDVLGAEGELAKLVEGASMRRRTVLAGLGAMATSPAVGLDDIKAIAGALNESQRIEATAIAPWLRGKLEECFTDDGALGPMSVLSPVMGLLATVEPAARKITNDKSRNDLFTVAAQGAEFAGWLYHDIGKPDNANHWLDKATEWAQVAGNLPMQGYVLLKKSQTAWGNRDATRMLTLAQAAQDPQWGLPAKVRAEAIQQEARGHAMLGASNLAIERKLDEAHRIFNGPDTAADHPQTRHLSIHYNEALLAVQIAICYCAAGKSNDAISTYERVLTLQTFPKRDYGFFLSLMAEAYVVADEPDEASRIGMEALSVAVPATSVRTLKELTRVRAGLARYRRRTAVTEFRDAVRQCAS